MNPTSRLKGYLAPKILFAGFLLLLVNSGYLAVSGEPTILYLANVLVHVGGGAALIIPFLWYARNLVRLCRVAQGKRSAAFAAAGVWAMSGGMGAGVALMILGNLTPYRWLLYLHIGLVAATVASPALAFVPYPQRVGQAP